MLSRLIVFLFKGVAITALAFQYDLKAHVEGQHQPLSEISIDSLKEKVQQSDNPVLMFQLGQVYEERHCEQEAIKWYKACIDRGGSKEAGWASLFKLGDIYNTLGFWDQALIWYLKAYQESPDRAEPLYKIAQHYRYAGQNHLAYLYANQGSRIPLPEGSPLLLTPSVYDYQFDEELSIAAFYTPYKEEGRAAADRLILKKGVPWQVKEQAYKNMVHYAPILTGINIKPIHVSLPPIREGLNATYSPLNPSIRKTADGYRLICRTVNYDRFGETGFKIKDPNDTKLRTKNFLIDCDTHLNVLSQKEIVENFARHWTFSSEGLEDCRLFHHQGQDWFTCATIGTHPMTIGQTLCKLSDKAVGTAVPVEQLITLKGPDDRRCEKNWLPFIKENQLFMIYSYDPFVLYKIDIASGKPETVVSYQPVFDLSHLRGSAAPIPFDDGYLVVVHEAVFDGIAYYMHRFLLLDNDFKMKSLSKPFFFKQKGVEYCSGMTLDHLNTHLLLTIGVEDREAYFVTMNIDQVKSLLEPLPPLNAETVRRGVGEAKDSIANSL